MRDKSLILILIAFSLIQLIDCVENDRIVIIGAGAAGISAAAKLFENGYTNVKILEAENRYGGRVYTKKFGDSFIELGAQFVHGEKGNVIYELANPLGLLRPSILDTTNLSFLKSDGTPLPLQHGLEQMGTFYSIIQKNPEFDTTVKTVKDYIIDEYRKRWRAEESFSSYMTEDLEKQFLTYFENYIVGTTAMNDWSNSNGIGYSAYKECEGNQLNVWKKTGYKTIFDILMKRFPDSLNNLHIEQNIIFDSTVTKIKTDGNEITIKTSQGKSYTADKVLVTVSLGVLKHSHNELFEPKLPEVNIKAIENLSFGSVNKILLEYAQPWWSSNWTASNILWTDDDLISSTDDKKWLRNIIGVFSLDDQPNLLSIWVVGKGSIEMETKTDDVVLKQVEELVNRVVEKQNGVAVTAPIQMIRSSWGSLPNFRGSYSYRGLSATNAGVTNEDLATPIKNSKGKKFILFAGEATHNTHFSTVHGAIESGFRAAREILE